MTGILIIEDDKSIAKHLESILVREGYNAYCAYGQKEGIRIAGEKNPDLVLLDISLPDGNGFVTFNAIRKSGDIPVIFLTADTDEISVVTGLEAGADDYISKPFRPMELLSRMNFPHFYKRGKFMFPLQSMAVSTVMVFTVVMATMVYAFRKLPGESIVELLKNENI